MSKELVVSSNRHETKLAVLEDGQLVEVFFQRANEYSLVGSIHKGRVTRVLPGMQSAFVNIGLERDAFLYVSDFFEETGEDYERLGTGSTAGGDERRRGRGDRGGDRGERHERVERQPSREPRVSVSAVGQDVSASTEAGEAPAAEGLAPSEAGGPAREGQGSEDRRGGRRGRRRRRGGRGGFPDQKFAAAGSVTEEEETSAVAAPEEEPEIAEATSAGYAEEEQLVLPGESLAKYRRRPAPPAQEARTYAAAAEQAPKAQTAETVQRVAEVEALEVAPPGSVVFDHPAAPSQAVTEDDITEAIEDAVDARLDELQAAAESALEDSDETFAARITSADEAEAAAYLAEDEGEAGEAEVEEADELAAAGEAELLEEVEVEAEGEEGAVAAAGEGESAEVREQPVARYIQPRSGGRNRRRGGRGRDRGDRGPREGREGGREPRETREAAPAVAGAEPALESPAGADIETVARPGRERRPREERAAPPSIADLLKPGQEIIVQIAKEPIAAKGARITSHVAIPGRFVVYMPTLDHHGVSRKVGTDEERARLKRVLQTHSEGMTGGFIVRTAGEGKSEADVAADMSFLYNLWLDIRKKAEKRPAPALLHHDLELVQRILRDQMNDQFKAVWVDTEEMFESIATFLERFQPAMASRLKLYTRPAPIFDAFNITAELEKALRPKVWLKSGGFIVINQTEALVAIDINTGKYVGRTSRLEDTIVKTNIEAVKEVARQIRLRDLGGIIVVDFIDMEERRNRAKVMQALEEAMRTDRAPYKILQFNDFGLVTITRRRVKQSLERALCTPCTTCEGAGYVKSVETVIGEILVEAHKIAKALEGKEVMLRVHPEVAKVLKSNQHHYLEEMEEIVGKHVAVTGDPLLHPEKFDMA